jgi:hypothetical protein
MVGSIVNGALCLVAALVLLMLARYYFLAQGQQAKVQRILAFACIFLAEGAVLTAVEPFMRFLPVPILLAIVGATVIAGLSTAVWLSLYLASYDVHS